MIRFVVDRHLGHLARWLRTLGYDAFFQVDASSKAMSIEVGRSQTVLVTTEGSGTFGAARVVLVPKGDPPGQLKTMLKELPTPLSRMMFTRCVICNVPVVSIGKETVHGKVPLAVYSRTASFTTCPSCKRVYWEGTHTARLRARLESLFTLEEKDSDPGQRGPSPGS
jgi:uncharacterized protein with PIN domain